MWSSKKARPERERSEPTRAARGTAREMKEPADGVAVGGLDDWLGCKLQTGANLGLQSDARRMPRSRPPHCIFGRKDPSQSRRPSRSQLCPEDSSNTTGNRGVLLHAENSLMPSDAGWFAMARAKTR